MPRANRHLLPGYVWHITLRSVKLTLVPCGYDTSVMTAIAKKFDARLNRRAPGTAKRVKQLVAEISALADHDALDLVCSRKVEQEVDIIDDCKAG